MMATTPVPLRYSRVAAARQSAALSDITNHLTTLNTANAAQIATIKQQHDSLLSSYHTERTNMLDCQRTLTSHITELQCTLTMKAENEARWREQFRWHDEELARTKGEMERQKTQFEETLCHLRVECDDWRESLSHTQHANSLLQQRLTQSEAECEQLRDQLRRIEQRNEDLVEEMYDLQHEMQSMSVSAPIHTAAQHHAGLSTSSQVNESQIEGRPQSFGSSAPTPTPLPATTGQTPVIAYTPFASPRLTATDDAARTLILSDEEEYSLYEQLAELTEHNAQLTQQLETAMNDNTAAHIQQERLQREIDALRAHVNALSENFELLQHSSDSQDKQLLAKRLSALKLREEFALRQWRTAKETEFFAQLSQRYSNQINQRESEQAKESEMLRRIFLQLARVDAGNKQLASLGESLRAGERPTIVETELSQLQRDDDTPSTTEPLIDLPAIERAVQRCCASQTRLRSLLADQRAESIISGDSCTVQ